MIDQEVVGGQRACPTRKAIRLERLQGEGHCLTSSRHNADPVDLGRWYTAYRHTQGMLADALQESLTAGG